MLRIGLGPSPHKLGLDNLDITRHCPRNWSPACASQLGWNEDDRWILGRWAAGPKMPDRYGRLMCTAELRMVSPTLSPINYRGGPPLRLSKRIRPFRSMSSRRILFLMKKAALLNATENSSSPSPECGVKDDFSSANSETPSLSAKSNWVSWKKLI